MIEKLFLSVGAMKAGTTWLHQQLADHPNIHFTPEKEVHYFAAPTGAAHPMRLADRIARYQRVVSNLQPDRFNARVQRNLEWYAKSYLEPIVDAAWYENLFAEKKGDAWCADFSNLYCLLDSEGWGRVREMAGSIRVVYSLRNPISQMWSHVKFQHEFAGLDAKLQIWSPADFAAFFSKPGAAGHSDYAANLALLRRNLDPSELKVLFFETIRSSPLQSLNQIEAFLGIDVRSYRAERLAAQVNPSVSQPMPTAFVAFARPHYLRQCEQLDRMGISLPAEWDRGE